MILHLVCNFFALKHDRSRCRSRWENLDRGQYPFQPIKFVNLVVPSPCETEPYNNGEYWPEVVTVRTEHREVRTKTTEGQYSPVRLEQARLVSSLLYGTRHEIHDLDLFRGNGPYGKIPTEKEPITTLRFT